MREKKKERLETGATFKLMNPSVPAAEREKLIKRVREEDEINNVSWTHFSSSSTSRKSWA